MVESRKDFSVITNSVNCFKRMDALHCFCFSMHCFS